MTIITINNNNNDEDNNSNDKDNNNHKDNNNDKTSSLLLIIQMIMVIAYKKAARDLKSPMDMTMSPLSIKTMLESNPLKSRILVHPQEGRPRILKLSTANMYISTPVS